MEIDRGFPAAQRGPMFTAERIQQMIEAGIPDCTAIVEDPHNDGHHFQARVTAPSFVGLSRVAQRRMVYKTLGEHMGTDIHALQLSIYTPDNWPG